MRAGAPQVTFRALEARLVPRRNRWGLRRLAGMGGAVIRLPRGRRYTRGVSKDPHLVLGVEPGSVTPFGLLHDTQKTINVVMDEDAWSIGQFRFHPMVNTATLTIDKEGFEAFLRHTGHGFTFMRIPQ